VERFEECDLVIKKIKWQLISEMVQADSISES
jgi:hypothetical protein